MFFSTVFLNVLLNCISQLYFSTVKWCVQQQKADHVCNRPTRRDPPITGYWQLAFPFWSSSSCSCWTCCGLFNSEERFCTLIFRFSHTGQFEETSQLVVSSTIPPSEYPRPPNKTPKDPETYLKIKLRIRGWVTDNLKESWRVTNQGQC